MPTCTCLKANDWRRKLSMNGGTKSCTFDWDGSGLADAPTAPETMQQAGLSLGFLSDLVMKTLYTRGVLVGLDLARMLCLPFKIIEDALRFLKDEKCIEVNGGDLMGRVRHRVNRTGRGARRAQEAMKQLSDGGP